MRRLIKVRDLFVHPVDRKGVLDQIVCSNAEEIDLGCEDIGTNGGAWNFNHRANLTLFAQRNARPTQLFLALSEHGLGAAQFIQTRDHGKHDFYVPNSAGTENSAQLRFKNVYVLETKTNSTPAKERI